MSLMEWGDVLLKTKTMQRSQEARQGGDSDHLNSALLLFKGGETPSEVGRVAGKWWHAHRGVQVEVDRCWVVQALGL